jgi:hypothetical protein
MNNPPFSIRHFPFSIVRQKTVFLLLNFQAENRFPSAQHWRREKGEWRMRG